MIAISNYYLCAHCDNCKQLWTWAKEVDCKAGHDTAKVMVDHNGVGGKRYDEPTDVCKDYESRRYG